MTQTPGDASVGEWHGSIKRGRRHAAKRFTARPRSGRVTNTHTHTNYSPVAINTKFNRFAVSLRTCTPETNHHILKAILVAKVRFFTYEIVETHGKFMCASLFCNMHDIDNAT